MEYWEDIPDFPGYKVSSYGQVLNEQTDRILDRSPVQGGALRVTLFRQGEKYTRSVKLLVAEAFVPCPDPRFDTPIHLDGHELNVKADNLAWRTRSFAWRYRRQFDDPSDIHRLGPLIDLDSNVMYRDIYEAGTANGILFKDIWRCIHGDLNRIHPTNQRILLIRHANQISAQR